MFIGVISDTHDHAPNLLKAVALFNEREVGLVVHCGDWVSPFMPDFCTELKCKIISVFGNNEGDQFRFLQRKEQKGWNIEFHDLSAELELDGKKLLVYHGHDKPLLEAAFASQQYDAIFTGHNHKAVVEMRGKTLHLNPGSTSGVCESKLTEKFTIALYDTTTNTAEIINLNP